MKAGPAPACRSASPLARAKPRRARSTREGNLKKTKACVPPRPPQGPVASGTNRHIPPRPCTRVSPVLRRARPADGPRFLALVQELAAYEKLPGPAPDAEARLLEDAFGPRPRYDLFLAELDGAVVAYAVVFETYSTFLAKPVLHLEDLYVTPSARRHGVATAMMRFLAAEALRRGCGRLTWVVLDWNVDAQRFYERMGATRWKDWWPYVAQGEALARMASGAPAPG